MMTRRKFLGTSAAAVGAAALAACGAAPTATPVPPTQTPVVVKEEVTKVVVQTQVVKETQVVEKQVTQVVEKLVTPTPAPTPTKIAAKITGTFSVVQKKDFFQSMNDWLRGQMAEFFTQQGWSWDIAYEAGYTSGTGFVEKFSAASAAGTPPDLLMHTDAFANFMQLKIVDPVDDVVNDAVAMWGRASVRQKNDFTFTDGKWYFLPYFERSDGGWYRDPAFKAKGIDVQKIRLYPDLWDACLQVTDPAKQFYGWGVTIAKNGDGDWFTRRVMCGWGAYEQDETGQYVTIDSPEMVTAVKTFTDLYTNAKWAPMIPPGVLAWTDTSNNENYMAGKLAYTQNGGTVYGNMVLQNLQPVLGETRFHPPAGGPVNPEFNSLSADYWCLFRGSKNQDAARATMRHFVLDLAAMDGIFSNSPAFSLPAYLNLWDKSNYIKTNQVAMDQKPVATQDTLIIAGQYPGPANNPGLAAAQQANYLDDMIAAVLKGTDIAQAVKDCAASYVKTFKDFGLPGEKA
jgi:multiple sugar transport system substrate-binding protein